ncbi:MAG TPA: ribonuclease HI family protein [Patescibacteria group bacterium]|nr:ribonuclease HI family protein [Patescibacteria group bacterium]
MTPVDITVRVDGASRGNPGPSGAGAVIEFGDGREPRELCRYLGETTNNVAEYRALLLALEEAAGLAAASITVRSDSELLVRQLRGEYKVRAEHLRPLHAEACRRLRVFPAVRILHVPREENRRADSLANLAIDQHRKG